MQQHCQLELEASKPKFKWEDLSLPGFILISSPFSVCACNLTIHDVQVCSWPQFHTFGSSAPLKYVLIVYVHGHGYKTPHVSFLSCLSFVYLQGRPLMVRLNVVKLAFQMFHSITMDSYTIISVWGKMSSERIKCVIKELHCKSCPLILLSLSLSLSSPCAPTPTTHVVPTWQ